MVEKKESEANVGVEETSADDKEADVELTEETMEEEVSRSNQARSLKKQAEKGASRGKTQAEKMFNDFISTIRSRQEDFTKAISDYTTAMDKPLADVIETDDEIIIKADLPGIDKSNINVSLSENTVEITAKFEEEYSEEDVDYILRERNYGETKKIISIPAKVKVKEVTAKFEDSILTINLPKVEAEKFKVDIK